MPYDKEKKKEYDRLRHLKLKQEALKNNQISPKEKVISLLKMSNITGRAAGKINIYKSKADGDYYYGTEPMAYRDRVVEKKLSADYAFDTVGKWNARKR